MKVKNTITSAVFLLLASSMLQATTAQEYKQRDLDWYNLSPATDTIYGVGANEAYKLLKGRKAKRTIVALIGSGLDVKHADLRGNMWENQREKANGRDDDGNGLIDDINGWNFLGNKKKESTVHSMNFTLNQGDREYFRLKEKYADYVSDGKRFYKFFGDEMVQVEAPQDINEYKYYRDTIVYESPLASRYAGILAAKIVRHYSKIFDERLRKRYPDQEITQKEFETLYDKNAPKDSLSDMSFMILAYSFPVAKTESWKKIYDVEMQGTPIRQAQQEYEIYLKANGNDYRNEIIGDDPNDIHDNCYGNGNLLTEDANIGTMEAGIIAGVRNNRIGIDGICNEALIMPLRASTAGDPYLKDIALAIKYAVDHEAKIIVLPSQNTLYPAIERKWIEDALLYAEQKDVLIIAPVTESSQDMAHTLYYPNRFMIPEHELTNLMIVAPSDKEGRPSLRANFGRKELDIHAPGKEIYTAGVGNTYGLATGTGMAAASLAGVAALVRAYFPTMKAAEVRRLLNTTTTQMDDMEVEKAMIVNERKVQDLFFYSDICLSGGIVNAANAVKEAIKQTK